MERNKRNITVSAGKEFISKSEWNGFTLCETVHFPYLNKKKQCILNEIYNPFIKFWFENSNKFIWFLDH